MAKLPDELKLNGFDFLSESDVSDLNDNINSYLANTYGYCNNGFRWKITIELTDIDWDEKE